VGTEGLNKMYTMTAALSLEGWEVVEVFKVG
jgi:hypothetical protein